MWILICLTLLRRNIPMDFTHNTNDASDCIMISVFMHCDGFPSENTKLFYVSIGVYYYFIWILAYFVWCAQQKSCMDIFICTHTYVALKVGEEYD